MKLGRSLQDLAIEVDRQRKARHDYVASTQHMGLALNPAQQHEGGEEHNLLFGDMRFAMTPLLHEQIATHTGIPMKYYRRMQSEAPTLLSESVNTWFRKAPQPRMIRTLDGTARAFLSNSYRPLDNDALLEAVLPPLIEAGVEVMSCEITPTRLYIKAVDPRINKDVPTGRRMGDGSHAIFDTLSPAIVISNSEVGLGALSVQTGIWTRACTNLVVFAERSTRRYHVGSRADLGEEVYALLSDRTRAITDAALWAQVRDVVKGAMDTVRFDALVAKVAAAANDDIKQDPVAVVEVTARRYEWTEEQRGSVLNNLIRGGDLTRYGLANAITRTAEDIADYDVASRFEQVGGNVIELSRGDWIEILEAA